MKIYGQYYELNMEITTVADNKYLSSDKIHRENVLVRVKCSGENNGKITNTAIIFLLDTSGNMRPIIRTIHACIGEMLERADDTCEMTIVAFNDDAKIIADRLRGNADDISKLHNIMNDIHIGGRTNISAAIALGLLQAHKYKGGRLKPEILMLTDGNHNVGAPLRKTLPELTQMLLRYPFPINVLSMGHADARVLTEIAELSAGGVYQHIPSIENIPSIIGMRIGAMCTRRLSNCVLLVQAHPGTRILHTTGVSGTHTSTVKEHKYYIGNITSGATKSLLCYLSVRALDATELITSGECSKLITINIICDELNQSYTHCVNRRTWIQSNPNDEIKIAIASDLSQRAVSEATRLADAGQFSYASEILDYAIERINTDDIVAELNSICKKIESNYTTERNSIFGMLSARVNRYGFEYQTQIQHDITSNVVNAINGKL